MPKNWYTSRITVQVEVVHQFAENGRTIVLNRLNHHEIPAITSVTVIEDIALDVPEPS